MDSRKYLSPDEREYLEALLIRNLDSDLRNSLMFLTALHTGARANELLGLEWTDINLESGEVILNTLKRFKNKQGLDEAVARRKRANSSRAHARTVFVPTLVTNALRRLKSDSPDRPFKIKYPRMAQLWGLYRPNKTKSLKSLRHSYAMHAYTKTKDIRFVQRALGHANIQNTMIYLDYQYTAQEYKKKMGIK